MTNGKQPAMTETPPGPLRRWLRGHRRALRESLLMPWHTPLSTGMTILTLAISFFLPLVLWTLWMNAEHIKAAWHDQGSIAVFLKPDVNAQQAGLLMQQLQDDPAIASATFISPENVRQQLQEDPQLHQVLALIKAHQLPTQLLLMPAEDAAPESIEHLIATQRLNPKVEYISYDPGWLRQLEAASNALRTLALASGMLFLIIVVVILGNTVGTHVARHHDEIRLLQLMGAPGSQIRRRFLYGGVLYGLLASLLAWLGLWLLLWSLHDAVQQLAGSYGRPMTLNGPDARQMLGYFTIALGITWLATRLALHGQIREPGQQDR